MANYPTNSADDIVGTKGDDAINALGGADTVDGRLGDDELRGSSGDDRLVGNGGADILNGGEGDDELRGGNENDILVAGNGDDRLNGGGRDDVLVGGAGDDALVAGLGYDKVHGGAGSDRMSGGAGDDVFVLRANEVGDDIIADFRNFGDDDRVFVGAGVTIVSFADSGNDALVALDMDGDGTGESSVRFRGWDANDLENQAYFFGAGADSYFGLV